MKQRLEATHFIEQYSTVGEYKKYADFKYRHTFPLPLNLLKGQLDCTKESETLQTVAIFKIKFKD